MPIEQGTLVATLLACAGVALRRQKAAVRYAAGCGMVLMLAIPLTTFLRQRPETGNSWRAPAAEAAAASHSARPARGLSPAAPVSGADLASARGLASTIRRGAGPLARFLVAGWILGVFLLSLRFLGGWTAVRRLVRRDVSPVPEALQKTLARLCRRLRVSRPVVRLSDNQLPCSISDSAVPPALSKIRKIPTSDRPVNDLGPLDRGTNLARINAESWTSSGKTSRRRSGGGDSCSPARASPRSSSLRSACRV